MAVEDGKKAKLIAEDTGRHFQERVYVRLMERILAETEDETENYSSWV